MPKLTIVKLLIAIILQIKNINISIDKPSASVNIFENMYFEHFALFGKV